MLWKYRIKTSEGEIQEGTLRTDSYQNATRELSEPGQQILSLKLCNESSSPTKARPVPQVLEDPGWSFGVKDLLAVLLLLGSGYYVAKRPQNWGPIVASPKTAINYSLDLKAQLEFDGPTALQNQAAVRVDVYFPEIAMVVSKKPAPLDAKNVYTDRLEIVTTKVPGECVFEVSQRGFKPYKQTVKLSNVDRPVDLGVCRLQALARPMKTAPETSKDGDLP